MRHLNKILVILILALVAAISIKAAQVSPMQAGFHNVAATGSGATQYIEIKPTDLCPEDTSPGTGTLTLAYDETNYETYARFTSSGTDQTLNVLAKFIIPSDFSSWASSNAITVRVRTSDRTNATLAISMYQNDNTVDSGVNAASVLPDANNTWEAKNDDPAGTYTAGQYAKIKLALQGDSADQCDVGMIRLDYIAAY